MQENTAPRSAKRVKRTCFFGWLPEELVIPVLSRLSPEDIIRCRKVCKEWRDITSTQYFTDLYIQSQSNDHHTVILVDSYKNGTLFLGHFLLDKWWESEKTLASIVKKFKNYPKGYPQCSGNGFVVMKSECNRRNFIVFNPCNHDNKVTISFPKTLFRRTEAIAIYFHPTIKQYCILWAVYWRKMFQPKYDHQDEKGIQYQILILGPNPCWKNINNPWIRNVKDSYKPTVLVDNYLYWVVKVIVNNIQKFGIMEFDIISEELKVMTRPVCVNNPNISLLNICGILSLFIISPTTKLVYQFTLTDRVLEVWTRYIYSISDMCQFEKPARVIARRDTGDLLIVTDKIYVFNIKLGTKKRLIRGCFSYSGTTFMSHVVTFASLSSCKSDITLKHIRNNYKSVGANGEPEKCTRRVVVV